MLLSVCVLCIINMYDCVNKSDYLAFACQNSRHFVGILILKLGFCSTNDCNSGSNNKITTTTILCFLLI